MTAESAEAPPRRQVSVWVPVELYELLRARSYEQRRTHTELIVEALSGFLGASDGSSDSAIPLPLRPVLSGAKGSLEAGRL